MQVAPEFEPGTERLGVVSGVVFEPSPAMRTALQRGVDLQLDAVVRVERRIGPLALPAAEHRTPLTIGFLPLTEQWRLDVAGKQRNFPRLWLLLDALEQPRRYEAGIAADQLSEGAWRIRFRVEFNRAALPAPMHLPALLSPQWRLTSSWHEWRFARS